MVPVNVAVGFAATRFTDRSMVLASVLASMLSLLALMAGAASSAAYFGGGVALFVGTVVLEGTATSLMSKCIWSGFARGVFNAGLLSTEAGTFGRFTGNAGGPRDGRQRPSRLVQVCSRPAWRPGGSVRGAARAAGVHLRSVGRLSGAGDLTGACRA